MIDNAYIAEKLKWIGKLLEVQGENPFKTRAYFKGAEVIKASPKTIQDLIRTSQLGKVPGIGSALKDKITDIYHTGTCNLLEKLESEIPVGVQEMLHIKGLGSKKIQIIWIKMGITTIGDLLYACNENRLIEEKGFGAKTQETIRKTLEYYIQNQGNFHFAAAARVAEQFLEELAGVLPKPESLASTGAFSRHCNLVPGIEFILKAEEQSNLEKALATSTLFLKESAPCHYRHTESGMPVSIWLEEGDFELGKFLRRSSEGHFEVLENHNPGSVSRLKEKYLTRKEPYFQTEAEIYSELGLPEISPVFREGLTEVALAAAGKLPSKTDLLHYKHITGALHNHSTWSDGIHSIEAMAKACQERGWTYLGISDHSKSAFYANGLSEGRIEAQHREIDTLNAKMAPFKIFKGIESDILYDGSLDYAPETLAKFDFIVASVHSQLRMDETKANERLIRAIENPFTTILGHPTGRLLLMREAYPIDHKKVIDACAANGVIIELNANPYRLDIDWKWIPYALEKGVMLAINPDAHKKEGLGDIKWGVISAQKGMLIPEMTLNAQPMEKVAEVFARKRTTAISSL